MIHPIRFARHGSARFGFAKNAYGSAPSFSECDFARFLWLLNGGKRVSRGEIARALGVGEGSVRTMIRALEKNGLIDVRRRGCGITEKGRKTFDESSVINAVSIPPTELSYGKNAFALVLSGNRKVHGLVWRDEAVKAGAEGATALFFKDGELQLPVSDYSIRNSDAEKILDKIDLREGNLIVLSYGRARLNAERGAWAAATALSKE